MTVQHDGDELVFDERFGDTTLNTRRWVDHYLPHWTTPDRSAARYDLGAGLLRLRIDADQPAWLPEPPYLRVSNLQTGTFSGPAGSSRGQHRHRDGLTVVTAQTVRRLFTPREGLVEATLRASSDPTCMLAFWLVGFEGASPAESGEICVCELFGHAIGSERSLVNMGVKAHGDPRLRDDMAQVVLAFDATDWHTYAAEWDDEQVRFLVDGEPVRTIRQRIAYPLQLMLSLFEFPASATVARDASAYPKLAEVSAVRAFRRRRAG